MLSPRIMNTDCQNSESCYVKLIPWTGGKTSTRKSDLPTVPELASDWELEAAPLPLPTVLFLYLCCHRFPKRAAKNGDEALAKGPELMTQCDLIGNLILEQKTFQNIPRETLCLLSQPVLQNWPSTFHPTASKKGHGAVGSEKCTFYKGRQSGAKAERANFKDFSGNNSRNFGLLRTHRGSDES